MRARVDDIYITDPTVAHDLLGACTAALRTLRSAVARQADRLSERQHAKLVASIDLTLSRDMLTLVHNITQNFPNLRGTDDYKEWEIYNAMDARHWLFFKNDTDREIFLASEAVGYYNRLPAKTKFNITFDDMKITDIEGIEFCDEGLLIWNKSLSYFEVEEKV